MRGPLRVERDKREFPRMHWLTLDGCVIADLTDAEADAIEAQLNGPDLTELREAVGALGAAVAYLNAVIAGTPITMTSPTVRRAVAENIEAEASVLAAARRLVYPEGDA